MFLCEVEGTEIAVKAIDRTQLSEAAMELALEEAQIIKGLSH